MAGYNQLQMCKHFGILLLAICAAAQSAPEKRVAPGWTGPESSDYEAGIDRKVQHAGHPGLYLKSITGGAKDDAVRQRIRADAYRSKRVKFSGWIKPDSAEQGGALWLRVDMNNGDYILDSMLDLSARDQGAKDSSGWARCELVALVPADALGISFGLRMKGKGQLWASDLAFETLTKPAMTTTIERRPYRGPDKESAIKRLREDYGKAPTAPVNLRFESQ